MGGQRSEGLIYQFLPAGDDPPLPGQKQRHHLTVNKYLMSWHDVDQRGDRRLNDIRLEVFDAAGKPVVFHDGPLVVKLVLRRKK